jgi:hypothetical protein
VITVWMHNIIMYKRSKMISSFFFFWAISTICIWTIYRNMKKNGNGIKVIRYIVKDIPVPNRWKSRLEFGMYSYTSNFSLSSMQQPKSLTRFLCCNLAIKITSFWNSCEPWPDVIDSLLIATSVPSTKLP